jgi:hypothetical protein
LVCQCRDRAGAVLDACAQVEVEGPSPSASGRPARYLIITIPPMQVDKLPDLRDGFGLRPRRFKPTE